MSIRLTRSIGLPIASCNRSIFSSPNLTGLNKFVVYSLRTSCSYGVHSRDDDGDDSEVAAAVVESKEECGGIVLEKAVLLGDDDDLATLGNELSAVPNLIAPLVDRNENDLHGIVLVKAPARQRRADARVAVISNGMQMIRIERETFTISRLYA